MAVAPGLALATTFTDTSGAGTFTVSSSPLGGISGCGMVTGTHEYAARTLTTNNSTLYTFTVTSSTGFSNDPFLAVYSGTFDPAAPTANLVACNDDTNGLLPEFQANLTANTTYTIVTTSYRTNVGGSATYEVTPDVTVEGAPVLSAVSVSGITSTTATLHGTSTAAGTGYFVVQSSAQAAPSAAQVIAGQQSTGAAAISSGSDTVAANTARSFAMDSLQPGTAYTAYLVVRDNQVPQLTSVAAAVDFTTSTDTVVPEAPTIGTATAGDAQASVTFTAPADDGGSAITGYTVTSSPGAITATGTASPIVVAGLSNGTSYTFTVSATNAIGMGPDSQPSNAVVPVGPPTLTDFGPFARTFGDAPSAIAAPTSNSAGAFTYTSSNPAVATISGDVVTVVSVGTTVITANQAADGAFTAASITADLVVAKAAPALSGFDDLSRSYGAAPFTITAPTSNSAGAFTYTSSNPAVATISGSTVTVVGAGSTTITATQAATADYLAGSVTAQLTVDAATPTLVAFGDRTATFGDAPITLTPPASDSTGAFTYTSSNPAVATISGNVVTIVGSGTTTITATQAADGNYASTQTTAQLTVAAATPALGGFADLNATFGDAPITLAAPSSPSAGAFTYTSSNPAVATISGNVVTIVASGTATLTATQAADGNYTSAQISAQLNVGKLVPTLSGFDDLTASFGQAAFTLTAPTSDSTGAFTYTSSNPAVATVSGDVVTVVGTGTTTLTATQAAQGSYAEASITAQLVVEAAAPTITGFGDLNKVYGQAAFDLVDPTSNSTGAFTYSIDNSAVATVNGRTVTLTGAGTATITATQAATANYTAGSVTALLVVDSRPDPTQDSEVVGGVQAQIDAAQRFVDAQLSNVRDRLRQRRATDAAGTANNLSLNSSAGEGSLSLQPKLIGAGHPGKSWSFWTGGSISAGERELTGSDNDYDYEFRSDGVTIGADTRIGRNLLLGVAVGGGWSDTDVGSNGSTVDATQRALTVYGLWHASDALFIDGQLGVGKLDYDLRRWSTSTDSMGIAQRDGSQVFGSLTFGYESGSASRRLTSYGRIDAGHTTLDPYRETGLGIYDLVYRKQTVEERSIAIGLEGSHNVRVDWAREVRPYWQLEYRNDFSRSSDADINYVVAPSDEDYRLSLKPSASSNWDIGVGTDFAFGNGMIVTALLRHELNVGIGSDTTISLQLSLDFGGNGAAATASGAPLQSMQDSKTAGSKKK